MDEKSQFVVDALSIEESWRIFRIMAEFVDAIETLSKVKHAVSIFGSARTDAGRSLLPEGGDAGPASRGKGIRRHHRRRSRRHGGGQQGGRGGRRPVGGDEHPPALGAEAEPLRQHQHRLQIFLHPEGDVRQVCHGLCHPARRLRDAGRALRGPDPHPDEADQAVSRHPHGERILEGACGLAQKDDAPRPTTSLRRISNSSRSSTIPPRS